MKFRLFIVLVIVLALTSLVTNPSQADVEAEIKHVCWPRSTPMIRAPGATRCCS